MQNWLGTLWVWQHRMCRTCSSYWEQWEERLAAANDWVEIWNFGAELMQIAHCDGYYRFISWLILPRHIGYWAQNMFMGISLQSLYTSWKLLILQGFKNRNNGILGEGSNRRFYPWSNRGMWFCVHHRCVLIHVHFVFQSVCLSVCVCRANLMDWYNQCLNQKLDPKRSEFYDQ